jgi:hypothetical protein
VSRLLEHFREGTPADAEADRPPQPEPPAWLFLFVVFGGITLWFLHLLPIAALVPTACEHDLTWLLNVITLVTLVGAVAAMAASVWLVRSYVSPAGRRNGRTVMLAAVGLLVNTISVMLIILEGVPVLVIDPCRRS